MAIEHADFDGIERLALVTGGEIASTFDSADSVRLGSCKLIEEIMIGEDRLIHFSGGGERGAALVSTTPIKHIALWQAHHGVLITDQPGQLWASVGMRRGECTSDYLHACIACAAPAPLDEWCS
jgi:hypothetical protein